MKHSRMDVAGAIRNRAFDGMTDAQGRPIARKYAERMLRQLLAEGVKYLPLGEPCEGWDDETGCPGHADVDDEDRARAFEDEAPSDGDSR